MRNASFGSLPDSAAPGDLDRLLAAPMFAAALAFLGCLAGVLHLYEVTSVPQAFYFCAWGLAALYPLFLAELGLHVVRGSRGWKRHLLFCLLPPLRLGARDHASSSCIWFPRLGWIRVDHELRRRAEQAFGLPMIVIALMILPLMAVEHFWSERIASSPQLTMWTHSATAVIWLAFTFEFTVMISIVDRKLRYCKEHWIDIAVILLPLVAFLRAARLGRLMRLQQLTKTARVYRMRGLMMKAWRAVLLLKVVETLLRVTPEKRINRLAGQIVEKELELMQMQMELDRLRAALPSPAISNRKAA